MTDAIRFQGLGHTYRGAHWVFRHYDGAIQRGSIFALLGPNGCGKTTLLKILLGALAPTEGRVERAGRVAFVPQLFHLSFDFSVLDVVLMGRARHVGLFAQPSASDVVAALDVLGRFGLQDVATRPFTELSGGQRQLAIFARAMIAAADILVLDEPTSALDFKNQQVILDWIGRLAHEDDLTVVLTTHSPSHALAVSDQALLMLGESTFQCGAVERVLTEENLERLYGVPISRETLTPIFRKRERRRSDAGSIV